MTGSIGRRPADVYYDGILPGVEKPSRYIDRELNISRPGFREGALNTLLVFPDVYEIGMTHQGIRLLYHHLDRAGFPVEFAFSPWPDMEKRLRASGGSLRSWQTGTEVGRFDLVGITMPYELHYTNILAFLELSGIPLEASARSGRDPLVVAGGPCSSNPLPILPAIDAVFLGDGEESLLEAVNALGALKKRAFDGGGEAAGRAVRLEALAGIEGVHVEGISERTEARVYMLKPGDLPRRPIVPSASIVHERLSVEIMRGCTRGCRFCHAGISYRPRRERSVDEIVEAVCEGLDSSGWEEVSLLSLSSSDYSRFGELLERLRPELDKRRVSLAMPSLRPETVCEKVVSASGMIKRSGFTLAPEAGTQRLRDVINKGMTEEDILQGCANILDAGWQNLKLYFMIGLPGETQEDVAGIAGLVGRISALAGGRRRMKINVSVSPFVPRVNTPFQWERQDSIEEIAAKESYLRSMINQRGVQLSVRDPRTSALEGVFARGTEALWPVVIRAYERGCRFDGWRDSLDFEAWTAALEEDGFTIDGLLGGFDPGEDLPWERFGLRVTRKFLLRERERAFEEMATADCRTGGCSDCGACRDAGDRDAGSVVASVRIEDMSGDRQAAEGEASGRGAPETGGGETFAEEQDGEDPVFYRYRLSYSRTGKARFISHRESINIIHRALRRSALPLSFSGGFHPQARISMGPSLAVGIEGLREFLDIELTEERDVTAETFNSFMPEGFRFTGCVGPFSRREGKLPSEWVCEYALDVSPLEQAMSSIKDCPDHAENVKDIENRDTFMRQGRQWGSLGRFISDTSGMPQESEVLSEDPAAWIERQFSDLFGAGGMIIDRRGRERSCAGCAAALAPGGRSIELSLPADGRPGPLDLLLSILPEGFARLVRITRTGIMYIRDGETVQPMDLIG